MGDKYALVDVVQQDRAIVFIDYYPYFEKQSTIK